MIKLLGLLLAFGTLNAAIFTFYLPDEGSRLEYHLQSAIKNAHTRITILTPSMHFPPLRKTLTKPLSRGIRLTMIVQEPSHDPLNLISYNHADLFLYSKRSLSDTLVLIDSTHVCHLPGRLNVDHVTHDSFTAWCTDDADAIHTSQQHVNRMMKRSHPYLQ